MFKPLRLAPDKCRLFLKYSDILIVTFFKVEIFTLFNDTEKGARKYPVKLFKKNWLESNNLDKKKL